jgi:hypothetical protein
VDQTQAARLGRNQVIARSLNEQLAGGLIKPKPPLPAGIAGFMCECSNLACTGLVYMDVKEYSEVRTAPARFVVRTGHQIPEIERVVGGHGNFVVVEKIGAARRAVDGGAA